MTAKLNWHMLDIPGLEPLDFFSRATPAYPYYFPNYTVLYPPQQHESDPSKQPTKHVHFPAQLAVMLTNRKKWPFGGPCLFSWLATKTDYPSISALRESRLKCSQQPIPSWRWRYKGGIVRCFRGRLEFVVGSVRTIPVKKQTRASVYYPSMLAAQNMASVHVTKYCLFVPEDICTEFGVTHERPKIIR